MLMLPWNYLKMGTIRFTVINRLAYLFIRIWVSRIIRCSALIFIIYSYLLNISKLSSCGFMGNGMSLAIITIMTNYITVSDVTTR